MNTEQCELEGTHRVQNHTILDDTAYPNPKAAHFRLASFWRKFSCSRKLVQENLRKLHVHTTQVSCSRKWLYPLEKSDLQSTVQSADEFHDRSLSEIERSIRASFWRQFVVPEKWRQKPCSHRQVFCRKKCAAETCTRNLPV